VRVHVSLFWWTWTIYESEVSSLNWVWEPQWLHSWPRASLDFRSTCSHMIFKKALLSRVWQYFGDHSIISCMCAVCTHVIVWHTRRHIHIHIHAWSNYHVIWMYYAAYDFFLNCGRSLIVKFAYVYRPSGCSEHVTHKKNTFDISHEQSLHVCVCGCQRGGVAGCESKILETKYPTFILRHFR